MRTWIGPPKKEFDTQPIVTANNARASAARRSEGRGVRLGPPTVSPVKLSLLYSPKYSSDWAQIVTLPLCH